MMEKVSYPFQTQSKPTLTAPQCTPPSPDLTTRIDHALFLTDFGAGRVHRFMHHRHVLRGAPRFMEKVSCPVQTDFDGSTVHATRPRPVSYQIRRRPRSSYHASPSCSSGRSQNDGRREVSCPVQTDFDGSTVHATFTILDHSILDLA